MLYSIRNALHQFTFSQSGNVAVIFALSSIPLVLAVGISVDYMDASKTRQILVNAGDAASLAGVKAATEYRIENPDAGKVSWKKVGRKAARKFFLNNSHFPKNVEIDKPKITFMEKGNDISSEVTFTGSMQTSFMKVIGKTSMKLSGTSYASAGLPNYAHINILIDVSSSMGIGATKADQQTLQDKIGCTLACHYTDIWKAKNTIAAARATGAILRIDVIKNAVTKLLASLKTTRRDTQQFSVSIYTFSNSITEVYGVSNDLDAAIIATKTIELTGAYGQGGTNLQYSLKQLADATKMGGDGSSLSNRKTYTVLMTDGLENSLSTFRVLSRPDPYISYEMDSNFTFYGDNIKNNSAEIIQGFNPNACKLIKDKNHQLLAINVKYLVPSIAPDSTESRYMYIKNELVPNIQSSMEKCVSKPSFAWNASSPEEITSAANEILLAVQSSSLRLTQ